MAIVALWHQATLVLPQPVLIWIPHQLHRQERVSLKYLSIIRIFIQEIAFEDVCKITTILSSPQYVDKNEQTKTKQKTLWNQL